jgi:thiamine biosynthesis lipoprotein
VLATVVGCALEWRAATAGTFDPTVGDAVIAAGYDQSFEAVRARANWALRRGETRPAVPVHGDTVRLNGTGTLDLGGIGKGWTADRVGALLRAAGATSYCIDAGGDLLIESGATGETLVELCSGGYRVGVVRGAVASSSVLHRRWSTDQGPRHHIVDPVTGEAAAHGWVQCSVVAADAETADVLATALLAGGERALFALAARGAEALIVGADARCLMTPGLAGWLR